MTDVDLVACARSGDTAALGELVRRHHTLLYRTALRIVRGRADAEDVTQSAWLQVFRHLHRFQGESSVTTWLVAIVRNQAIDSYRASGRRARRDAALGDGRAHLESIAMPPSPEDIALLNERHRQLADCVRALPPTFRQPLSLWQTGYSYAEIARIFRVPVGTIKSRVFHARRRVAGALRHHQGACANL